MKIKNLPKSKSYGSIDELKAMLTLKLEDVMLEEPNVLEALEDKTNCNKVAQISLA